MTRSSLFPVPKVLIPTLLIAIGILTKWIATGELDRVEIAALAGSGLHAILGYATPPTYDQVQDKVSAAAKVIPGTGRPKRRRRR